MDATKYRSLSLRFSVNGYPTFFFISANGTGALPRPLLQQACTASFASIIHPSSSDRNDKLVACYELSRASACQAIARSFSTAQIMLPILLHAVFAEVRRASLHDYSTDSFVYYAEKGWAAQKEGPLPSWASPNGPLGMVKFYALQVRAPDQEQRSAACQHPVCSPRHCDGQMLHVPEMPHDVHPLVVVWCASPRRHFCSYQLFFLPMPVPHHHCCCRLLTRPLRCTSQSWRRLACPPSSSVSP